MSMTKAPSPDDYRTLLVRKSKLEKRREYDNNYSESSFSSQINSSYCDYMPVSSSSECLTLAALPKSPICLYPIIMGANSSYDNSSVGQQQDELRKSQTDFLADAIVANLEISDDEFESDKKAIVMLNNRRLLKKKSLERSSVSLGSLTLAR